MYSDLKTRVVKHLDAVDTNTLDEWNYNAIIEILDEYEKKFKGCISWCAQDVVERAKESFDDYVLTDQEAQDILELMISKHDCTLGITWETIDYYIQEHKDQKEA